MKNLSIIKILVLTAGLAGGVSASDLPDCPTDGGVRWHNCFGTFTVDLGKYVGEWKDDKFDGQGTATFADGGKYVGEWKDNKFDGQGTATFADGNKYVGEWKDDKMNGKGTYTSTDRTIREGIWEDGEFLGTVAEVERAERTRIAKEEREKQARIAKEERELLARLAKEERERLARLEKRDKYERIYNACMLDKSPSVDMSVTSVEKAVKATCDSIAEDPSFLEGLRYD
jgi:hypothetical protein